MRAAICKGHKAWAAGPSDLKTAFVDASPDAIGNINVAASYVSEVRGLPRIGAAVLVSHVRPFYYALAWFKRLTTRSRS